MRIKSLELEKFRNYHSLNTNFSSQTNLIYGDNAQGKTNLIESIGYLAQLSSHRTRHHKELIAFGEEYGKIKGFVEARERQFELEVQLSQKGRRQIYSNQIKLKKTEEFTGTFQCVMFCPEDLSLIRGGAIERRRFLDSALCQLRPKYATALFHYRRLYEHKTRILRDWKDKPSLLDTLDAFNLAMAQTGSVIIHYRAHFLHKLREFAFSIHQDFSGEKEELNLCYHTVSTIIHPEDSIKDLIPQLLAHQESHRKAELESRQCLSGPHKDDIMISLNQIPAKTFGSQGQARTATLSLKLACRELFYDDRGEWPVLLLDDVLSELDPKRQAFVLNRIRGGQVFITCCEEDKLEGLQEGACFHIKEGRLEI